MPTYRFDAFELDTAAHTLTRRGVPLVIEPKPYAVLRYLAERWPNCATQDEMIAACWPGISVSRSALQGAINNLRRAIGQGPGERYPIECLYTHGYRIKPEVAVADTTPASSARPPGDVLSYRFYAGRAMQSGKTAEEAAVEADAALRLEHQRFGP